MDGEQKHLKKDHVPLEAVDKELVGSQTPILASPCNDENVHVNNDIKRQHSQNKKKVPISFRAVVKDIPSTTHGTFSVYQYPAKFIPQVIAFIMKRYLVKGTEAVVFDPFAGHGTVGIVARVFGHHYVLWDLNPLLTIIHDTAVMTPPKIRVSKILDDLAANSSEEFVPKWKNLHYWFPEEFLPLLSRAWGYVHSLPTYQDRLCLYVPLIKVTRYFSWADEKVHKLYKSRRSKTKIRRLLESDWQKQFFMMLEQEISKLLVKLRQYHSMQPRGSVNALVRSGIDVLETQLDSVVDVMITSPPYLQAQEYIRSTKLALYWLGHDDRQIKELSRREIPYRKVKRINVHSDIFHEYREKIDEEHLVKMYDNYFHAVLGTFTNLSEKISRMLAIFVSPATIRTHPIPIDDIFIEHLQALGWEHEITYIDTIKTRTMFETKVNPASGLKHRRMATEHLIIMKK